MNTISTLKKYIDDAIIIADNYKTILAKEPDNFAHKLSLITINEHINDLQTQLRREKELREKEVIELRLKGESVRYGTIPLFTLSNIIKNISDAILSASYRHKKGTSPKGQIPKEIINTLDLRFSGISSGSTRLFLTGKNLPDILGDSLIEYSLENTFNLLNSSNSDQMTDTISKIGVRSARRINRFLKILNSSDLEVEMSWSSPSDKNFKWKGNKNNILSISNSLENVKLSKPDYIKYSGNLIMISLKSRFEIEDKSGYSYRGAFPSELTDDVKKLHIGDKVQGLIEKNTITNQITGRKKTDYVLLKISKL